MLRKTYCVHLQYVLRSTQRSLYLRPGGLDKPSGNPIEIGIDLYDMFNG